MHETLHTYPLRYPRSVLLAIIGMAGTIFQSCSDKKQDPGPLPVILLSSPQVDLPLSNTVNIKASVEPNSSLKMIQLEIDGKPDTTIEASAINFNWNSKKVHDGVHQFKLIAETSDNREIELSFEREVLNTLFELSVSSKYVADGSTQYVVINNKSGQLIGYYQLRNNLNVPFSVPIDHNWETSLYSVTLFHYSSRYDPLFKQTYYSTSLNTFVDIEPGKIFLDKPAQESISVKGNHQFIIPGAPTKYDDLGVSGKGVNSFSATRFTADLTITVPLRYDPTDLTYYIVSGDSHKYIKRLGSRIGKLSAANYSDFLEMENAVEFIFSEPLRYRYFIYGVNDKQFQSPVSVASRSISSIFPPSEKLVVRYPNESYDQYITSISAITPSSRADFYHQVGESVATDFKRWEGSLDKAAINGRVLETKLSKEATLVRLSMGSSTDTPTTIDSRSWAFYLPGTLKYSIGVPQLPFLFSGLFAEEIGNGYSFGYGDVIEIIGPENTYRDFARQFLNEGNAKNIYGSYLFGNNTAMMDASLLIPNSGGRGRANSQPPHLPWEPPDVK